MTLELEMDEHLKEKNCNRGTEEKLCKELVIMDGEDYIRY